MSAIRSEKPRVAIARRLEAARKKARLTAEVAAREFDVARQQWRSMEIGTTSIPAERLLDVCAIVNVEVAWLLGGA